MYLSPALTFSYTHRNDCLLLFLFSLFPHLPSFLAESKLRVQKNNQSQVYLEDSRVRINCSITSQTNQDSQHTVMWYVRRATGSEADELLLRIERSGAFEYGAYADEERLRRRVQAERLSPRLYVLTLNRAESSDSGTYYCLVEEWLSDPDGVWYRLSRDSSGFTQVLVRKPGEQAVLFPLTKSIFIPTAAR